MHIKILQKLAAVAVAVMMNAALMGTVVCLFDHLPERPASTHRYERHDGAPVHLSARANQLIVGTQRFPLSI